MDAPRKGTKIAFWLILSFFSAVFAELPSGSFPYMFTDPAGWLLVIPLYGLHILVLGSVALSRRRFRFSTLYLCGVLFGLYEAYITKVLWAPYWDSTGVVYLGVHWIETAVLILWWHPFMSFIIPLFVASALMTRGWHIVDLPPRFQGWFTSKRRRLSSFIFAAWIGGAMAGLLSSPHVLIAPIVAFMVLTACLLLWRKRVRRRYYLRQLMPDRRETGHLLWALAFLYVILTLALNPDKLPGLVPQATILAIYAVVLGLLYEGTRKQWGAHAERPWRFRMEPRGFALHFAVFMVGAVLAAFTGLGILLFVASWVMGPAIGVYCLAFSMTKILRKG